jgi:hypothetical protein
MDLTVSQPSSPIPFNGVRKVSDTDLLESLGIIVQDTPQKVKTGMSLQSVMALIPKGKYVSFNWEMTPEDAQWLLDNQHPNRSVDRRVLNRIKDDINHGRFVYNGKPILLCQEEHREFDGQTRLTSCVETGEIIFVRIDILPYKVHKYVDINDRPRTFADILKMKSVSNANDIQTVCNWIYRLYHEKMLKGRHCPSPRALDEEVFQEYGDEIQEVLKEFRTSKAKALKYPSWFAGCYVLARRYDPEKAEKFFIRQLVQGLVLTEDCPAKALRERVHQIKAQGKKASQEHSSSGYLYQITFKCWNAYLKGKTIKTLILREEEEHWPIGFIP